MVSLLSANTQLYLSKHQHISFLQVFLPLNLSFSHSPIHSEKSEPLFHSLTLPSFILTIILILMMFAVLTLYTLSVMLCYVFLVVSFRNYTHCTTVWMFQAGVFCLAEGLVQVFMFIVHIMIRIRAHADFGYELYVSCNESYYRTHLSLWNWF